MCEYSYPGEISLEGKKSISQAKSKKLGKA